MADLRGQQLKDSYQDVITDSGSDLAGIENGNGVDITGRIVERGSNSDGEYVRFGDGTQICWINDMGTITDDINTATAGGFRNSGRFWDFPVPFSTPPNVQAVSLSAAHLILRCTATTESTTAIQAWRADSATDVNVNHSVKAIGRWK